MMSNEVRVVFCTVPDPETAHRIARDAVEHQYAACANLLVPVKSIYRWRGRVEQVNETLVLFKTSAARYPDLEAFLVRSHPYEVPEIIALPLSAGFAAYVRWVVDNSTPIVGS